MTVTVSVPVLPRMWRGYDDPGLPVGVYISLGLGIGDVSGGVLQIEHAFKLAGNAASARLYNIEQLNTFSTDATNVPGFIVAVGFEELPTVNVTVQRWNFELRIDGSGFASILKQQQPDFPLFIGQSSPDASVLAALNIGIANPGAGLVFQSVVQGYIWEPRGAQSEGGLRRPTDRLYGH